MQSIEEINGFELKLGQRSYLFRDCETPFNNISSSNIAADKYCTSKLLERAGIPVPKAISINADEFQQNKTAEKIAHLKFPLVIKPLLDGSQGRDVLCNIQNADQLTQFLTQYFTHYDQLIIEEFHGQLKSFRVLVFNRQVIGIVLRHPARVEGDGIHTIAELIELTNKKRKKINDFLGPIVVDEECNIKLKELGITLEYIPIKGETVVLCYTSNATRGGTFESLGKTICKTNRKLMIKVASTLNITLAGIDVECADINEPIDKSGGVIIEVNHRPSIRIHELPMQGKPNLVTRTIMRYFIFRHPLSYLRSLYMTKPSAFYVRTLILISFLGIIYLTLASFFDL